MGTSKTIKGLFQSAVGDVALELESDLPNTMADFHQMQLVFVNMVNNADQAMLEAHGGGKLQIKSRKIGEMIQIAFTDDGPGISEENMKRILTRNNK